MSSTKISSSLLRKLPSIENPPKNMLDKKASIVARLIWAVVFVAGVIATLIGCVDVIRTYQAKPITTEYHIIPNDTMDLPSVHLCVQDHLMSTYRDRLQANLSSNLSMIFQHHLGTTSVPLSIIFEMRNDAVLVKEYQNLKQKVGAKTIQDLLRHWALKCEDVVLSCGALSSKECCQNVSRYRTYIGTCFTFPPKKQTEAGMFRGFTLSIKIINATMFLCPNQQFCGLCTGSKTYCTFRRANIEPPWTSIEVRMKIFEGLKESTEDCKDVQKEEKYSEHVCSWECILNSIAQLCGCNHLHFPQIYGNLDYDLNITCNIWDVIMCNAYFSDRQLLNHTMLKGIQKSCSKSCPAPCRRSEYTFDIITNPFSTMHAEGTMLIDVFYASMEYVFIRQRLSMTFLRALTNLGGHLSLYLGVSLISMLNILFIITQCAQHYAGAGPDTAESSSSNYRKGNGDSYL